MKLGAFPVRRRSSLKPKKTAPLLQKTLSDIPPEGPPKGLCDENCFMAVNEKYNCFCGSRYHGLSVKKTSELKPQQQVKEAT